jgi:hypothetical protein
LALCLGINDDINQTNKRYDEYKAHRKPPKYVSCFTKDYAHLNLNNKSSGGGSGNNTNSNVNLLDLNFGGGGNSNVPKQQGQGGKPNEINDFFDMFK